MRLPRQAAMRRQFVTPAVSLTAQKGQRMARSYAAILGPLALVIVILRGVRDGSGTEAILLAATLALLMFSAAGFALGAVAKRLIEDAVRSQLAAEFAARHASDAK